MRYPRLFFLATLFIELVFELLDFIEEYVSMDALPGENFEYDHELAAEKEKYCEENLVLRLFGVAEFYAAENH